MKTGLLMAVLFGIFMGLGRLIGGMQGLVFGFVFALATNFFAYWFSDKIALSMNGAREVREQEAPQLFQLVGRLAVNAGLPMPRVYIIPSEQPNAFATGRNPSHAAIAVTDGIVRLLTPDELKAVLAHELSHVKNRDILTSSIAATVAGAIGFMAQLALWFGAFSGSRDDRDREGGNPVAALLAAIVAPIAATLIQLAISRSREYDADAGGARLCGQPLSLASALAKIERAAEVSPMNVNPATAHMYIQNPLGGDALKGIAALFRTHPPTSERIARLRAMA